MKFKLNILYVGHFFPFSWFFEMVYFKLTVLKNKVEGTLREETILRELESRNNYSESTRALLYHRKQRIKVPVYFCLQYLIDIQRRGPSREKKNNNILQLSFTWKNIHFGVAEHWRTRFRQSLGNIRTRVYLLFICPNWTVSFTVQGTAHALEVKSCPSG